MKLNRRTMKVDLQCGDTITIPEGCKAIVKNGSVVFEKEDKVSNFKDGDTLVTIIKWNGYNGFICKDSDVFGYHLYYVGIIDDGNLIIKAFSDDGCKWGYQILSHATEEEKQILFDKMKEQGLRWNTEGKLVKDNRWRAKKGGDYYFIDADLKVKSIDDTYSTFNNKHWDALNYFRTKVQTKEAAKRVKETLRKYQEEIGE